MIRRLWCWLRGGHVETSVGRYQSICVYAGSGPTFNLIRMTVRPQYHCARCGARMEG